MTEQDSVTMSDRLTPKFEEESNDIIVGGSIDSENDRLIDTDLDDETLKILFQGNEIAFRLITKWSQDPVEKGWYVKTDDDIDLDEQVKQYRQKLDFDSHLMELNKFVNVFGSAGIGYDVVDSKSSPDQPIDPEDVEDITGINLIRQDQVDGYEVDDDGEIEYYDLEEQYDTDRIHASRFEHGRYYHIEGHPEGFGLLHPLFTSLKVFENVKFGMGQAFYVGGTGFPVLNVENLDGMKDKDKKELRKNFMKDVLKNPGMILDSDASSLEFQGSQGKALDPDAYVSSLLDIVGSVVGSKQVLTGAIPGGVEGSETNKEEYFGDVSSFQQNKIQPIIRNFVQRLIDYGLIDEPSSGFTVEFNDLFEKDEQTKAEITETKSKAFMNLTASGVPADVAAEEVGLSMDTVEELQSEDPSESGQTGGEEGSSNPPGLTDSTEYDRKRTRETIQIIRDQDGYDPERMEDIPENINKPINWSKPIYGQYKDLREKHEELFEEYIDRIIDAVDEATVTEDKGFFGRLLSDADEERRVSKFVLERNIDAETEKLKSEMQDATRDGLQSAFILGAEKGAADFGESTTRIFDKHRKELLDETFDKYVTDAYADQTDKVNSAIKGKVEEHFKDQDSGIGDLKRSIRSVHSGDDSEMYRFDRIARTETARIRNVAYIDETSRRGRNLYDWVGPTDQKTTEICLNIKGSNPYTKKGLMDATRGGLPHINCRHTSVVNTDSITSDEMDTVLIDELSEQYLNIEFDVSMERLDEAYAKFTAAVNMDSGTLKRWGNGDCSKKASQSREPIERVQRLKSKNKANWDEDDIQDALRVWSFVNRMLGMKPEDPRDGPDGCDSKWAISLKNWGHNPFAEDGGSVSLN